MSNCVDPGQSIDGGSHYILESLPLLSRRAWFKKTKHRYARGIEPVRFVTRIRAYYDVLVKIDSEINFADEVEDFDLRAPAI